VFETKCCAAQADVFNQHMLTTITNWQKNSSANMLTMRQGSGMSQQQLADVLGVSTQVVAECESGEKELSIALLAGICNFFGVSVYDFLVRKLSPEEAVPRRLGACLWSLVCASPDGSPRQATTLESYCHRTLCVSTPEKQENAPIISITIGELVAPGYAACAVQLRDMPQLVSGLLCAQADDLISLTFASVDREANHFMLLWQSSDVLHGSTTPALLLDCVAFSPLQPHMTTLMLTPRPRP